MTNYREILRLNSLGINNSQIAQACDCARSTVVRVLQQADELQFDWEKVRRCSNEELSERLFPTNLNKPIYHMPDYEHVYHEMQRNGVTLNLLWLEYCDQCRGSGELPYKSTQFNKYYADYVQKTKATMHIDRKPGEVMEVDWAGQTAYLVDTDTGEQIKAYIFVSVLPYSGYAYVEAFLDMKQENWLTAHVNAYRYFGGVTRILTPDNLKTGIVKNTKEETIIKKTYQELAEHYGTAIIPARPRTPKDKATVEGAVGVISTCILAALRNQQFFYLRDLNEAVRERLRTFNHKPFQKKDGSRATAYEEEKLFLSPLPEHPFELAMWKIAVVQYNYHVSIDKQNYSVPSEYIKQKVDVRITKSTVEIFFGGNRIASHTRLYGRPSQYSTTDAHMPPEHQKYLQWNGERFRSWAEKIGKNTVAVVRLFLSSHQVEQQGYKSCMALLKLSDKYTDERLEAACAKAFTFTSTPSLKIIQSILKSGQAELLEKTPEQKLQPQYGFTRGATYYRGRNE